MYTPDELFTPVTWPESQELMELPGFEENALLINDQPLLEQYGSSAYLVRVSWLESLEAGETEP